MPFNPYNTMNQEEGNDEDQSPDHWFSHFEDECFDELESEGRIEARLQSAEEHAAQQLYSGFQSTSTAIAQLYNLKASSPDSCHVLMVPFNKAAESLTKFYKDSLINARECLRLGVQSGRNSRARDIAAWARKKRKSIRRDELLAYLCGRSIPTHAHHHHRNRQNRSIERQLPRRSHQNEVYESGEFPVRDALSLQGLNGAMSNISMGYNRPVSTTSSSTSMSRTPAVMEEFLFHHHDEFSNCGCATDYHHGSRKRHGSSSCTDVNMESPSRKRGKYL